MELRDAARIKARSTGNDNDWADFRNRRNHCTKLQKADKATFLKDTFERLEDEKDSGKIHATARDILGIRAAGPPTSFLISGRLVRKQDDLANAQLDYYIEKLDTIRKSLPKVRNDPLRYISKLFKKWNPPGGKPKFSLKSVTVQETLKMLSNLKHSHSFGRDELDPATIKLVAPILAPTFTHIINLSLGTSTFPMKWKISRIVPLLKSIESDKHNPASYRPVAQLPLISKLTERSAQVQILRFLEDSHQLSPNHHAYRRGTSTTTALIQLSDMIAVGADRNEITATMTTDLSAAFDTVDHDILEQKLKYYGLDKTTLDWIHSYLAHRSAYVVVGSGESRMTTTFCGVPQGSCLGPLLYLIFINELPSIINEDTCGEDVHQETSQLFSKDCSKCGTLPVFADDAQYVITSRNRYQNQIKIEENFEKLKEFFNDNGLQIN